LLLAEPSSLGLLRFETAAWPLEESEKSRSLKDLFRSTEDLDDDLLRDGGPLQLSRAIQILFAV